MKTPHERTVEILSVFGGIKHPQQGDEVLRIVTECIADERERCATIADEYEYKWAPLGDGRDQIAGEPAGDIAAAIRAEGNSK